MTATATNWGPPVVLSGSDVGGVKRRIVSALGPTTYSSGGNEFDCSADATDGFGNAFDAFNVVHSVKLIGIAPGTAASASTYQSTWIPATAYAAATGKLKVDDLLQATPAENAASLAALVFLFEVIGR